MIIHPPERSIAGGKLRISAQIELEVPSGGKPDHLWFEFPVDQKHLVQHTGEGFAIALLLLAMHRGEPLVVRGGLSPRLAYGLEEYQRAFCRWFPGMLRPVPVRYEEARASKPPARPGAGTAFSGGVDSFHTLRAHLPGSEKRVERDVRYALFGHGFDIPLADAETFRVAERAYQRLMKSLGVTLVPFRTNIRALTSDISWGWTYGSALIGAAHVAGAAFSTFYVPAGHTYEESYPTGSDPRIDYLLSSETLQVIHHGAGNTRGEKIAQLTDWPATYDALRVCWEQPERLNNCGQCEKCLRTMVALELSGVRAAYTTFPAELERSRIRRLSLRKTNERLYARQLIRQAHDAGRPELAWDLRQALVRSRLQDAVQHARAGVQRLRARAAMRSRARRLLTVGRFFA